MTSSFVVFSLSRIAAGSTSSVLLFSGPPWVFSHQLYQAHCSIYFHCVQLLAVALPAPGTGEISFSCPPVILHPLSSCPLPPLANIPGSNNPDSCAQPHEQIHHNLCRKTGHKFHIHTFHSHSPHLFSLLPYLSRPFLLR